MMWAEQHLWLQEAALFPCLQKAHVLHICTCPAEMHVAITQNHSMFHRSRNVGKHDREGRIRRKHRNGLCPEWKTFSGKIPFMTQSGHGLINILYSPIKGAFLVNSEEATQLQERQGQTSKASPSHYSDKTRTSPISTKKACQRSP